MAQIHDLLVMHVVTILLIILKYSFQTILHYIKNKKIKKISSTLSINIWKV